MTVEKNALYRPLIGVAPRWFPAEGALCASESLGDCYLDAILAAGGMPMMMPITNDAELIEAYVNMCDGFSIPGGQDINPQFWGSDEPIPEEVCPERDEYEFLLIKKVLERDKPLLATCRGMQMLNVVRGGSICMDINRMTPRPGMALWHHSVVLKEPTHPVEVRPGTTLYGCVGERELIQVNSSHHCCVLEPGEDVDVVGYATDGIPEAIEVRSQTFCLGVQWHPEYMWHALSSDRGIWDGLVAAARARRERDPQA
ncbi:MULTISPECIES: gamma-glutamyl-gamma-aminobutyrate hydrolase family protein [Atopobiaceae]|uniref:Glutamine amidotransferase n=1 Tax=Parafannyhessea umbonata TaxID=604330 RepID=A0A1H6K5M4_9ACTN|nr:MULTISPECIES: gamma-glutamyl-gamma-aminobutyrate hydrolase family protein [Atopobiaceae]SEH66721.1 putative glutamine amidotransferase [Parafannyhessea umbonata]SJZ86291.1 putative glutamine amidotransferase [Olsenella sp. KH1P3]